MRIIGGTYSERVLTPSHLDDCAGSGFRAAAALASIGAVLSSWSDAEHLDARTAGARALGFSASFAERKSNVEFQYLTPMSPPSRVSPDLRGDSIEVEEPDILRFGLTEDADVRISAERMIFDPQSIDDLVVHAFLASDVRTRFLCANSREIGALSGEADVAAGAERLQQSYSLDAVVVKCGAAGSYVRTSTGGEWVGAIVTDRVWKLGSGDVFCAGMSFALSRGADPVEAARVGSRSAAHWVSTRSTPIPEAILNGDLLAVGGSVIRTNHGLGRVYLAAPFFTVSERWLVETCVAALRDLGAEVFSPIHEVGLGGPEVANADIAGLERCDSVLALLDHADPGTLYECGWARSRGIPVAGYTSSPSSSADTMLIGLGDLVFDDLTSAIYNAAWLSGGT